MTCLRQASLLSACSNEATVDCLKDTCMRSGSLQGVSEIICCWRSSIPDCGQVMAQEQDMIKHWADRNTSWLAKIAHD